MKLLAEVEDEAKADVVKAVERKIKANNWSVSVTDSTTETDTDVQDDMNAARIMHMVLATLEENQYSGESAPLADDEKQALRGILKRLAGTVGKDEFRSALDEEELAMSPESEQALCDEVAQYETAVGDLTDQLNAVRKEYNALYQDMEALQDALVDEKVKTRKVQENYLTTLVALRDGKVNEDLASTLNDEGIESELTRLTDEVDMVKITDKLGDGMSRIPTESIDDPTEVKDNNNQERFSVANLQRIEMHYSKLLFTRGQDAAEAYKARMIREGYLPNLSKENN